jgi:uncharacterized membrane protein YcaP (DUF421 family)
MRPIMAVDWQALLVPSVSLLELVIRGSVMYLFVFVAMRLFRREAGALSTADLLVVVFIADAAQNGMASEYHSLTEGAVLVGTIFAWNYGLDWLGYRFPRMHRLLNPPPLLLIENGRLQPRNLRAEMLTKADLAEHLRQEGVEDFAEVRRCYLESDGHLSVIKRSKNGEASSPPKERSSPPS